MPTMLWQPGTSFRSFCVPPLCVYHKVHAMLQDRRVFCGCIASPRQSAIIAVPDSMPPFWLGPQAIRGFMRCCFRATPVGRPWMLTFTTGSQAFHVSMLHAWLMPPRTSMAPSAKCHNMRNRYAFHSAMCRYEAGIGCSR